MLHHLTGRDLARIKERVKEVIDRQYGMSLEKMISEINPILRGWDNYHRKARCARKRIRRLNWYVHQRIRIFLKRKYSDQSRGIRRAPFNLMVRLGLYQFG